MQKIQYNRQKTFYQWSLILCILALFGYTFYYEYERFELDVRIFTNNLPLYIRLSLILYFTLLLSFLSKFPIRIFKYMGYLIMVPLGWSVSIICYYTIGYEGFTITGFIFLILSAAVVFDFTVLSFSLSFLLIAGFHFTLMRFYSEEQPIGFYNHVFLFSLSGIIGVVTCYLVNIVKKNEAKVLAERELLVKEIHHRVKNNLQIVSSLFELQSETIQDKSTKTIVKEGQSRIKSIALIHQLLYQTDTVASIDFSKYITQLMSILHNTYKIAETKVIYFIDAQEIKLDIDTAVPLGLITNELITNAYKYAFIDKAHGRIEVNIYKQHNEMVFSIADDGIGIPKSIEINSCETLGLKLVALLSRQIKARLEFKTDRGTEIIIHIPLV